MGRTWQYPYRVKLKSDLLQWSFLLSLYPPMLQRPCRNNHVPFFLLGFVLLFFLFCFFVFLSGWHLKARESLKDVITVEVAIHLSKWEEGECNYLNKVWWAKKAISQKLQNIILKRLVTYLLLLSLKKIFKFNLELERCPKSIPVSPSW